MLHRLPDFLSATSNSGTARPFVALSIDMLRSVVIVGTLVGASLANPSRTIVDVAKETGAARIAAHQAAMKSEAEVAKLVSWQRPLGWGRRGLLACPCWRKDALQLIHSVTSH